MCSSRRRALCPAVSRLAQSALPFCTGLGRPCPCACAQVCVKVCLGYIRHVDGTIQKTYSDEELQVPLQVTREEGRGKGGRVPCEGGHIRCLLALCKCPAYGM